MQLNNIELGRPGRSSPSTPLRVSARHGGASLQARSSGPAKEASISAAAGARAVLDREGGGPATALATTGRQRVTALRTVPDEVTRAAGDDRYRYTC